MTKIFESYEQFLLREDKKINGVSKEYINFENDNIHNIGCWDCSGCRDCIGCIDSSDILQNKIKL